MITGLASRHFGAYVAGAHPLLYGFTMTDDARARALIDEFAFLDGWEDRYRHVIELGKQLAPLSAAEHNPANKVSGCVSQVWLVTSKGEGTDPALEFRADSDAHIVRGLAALLIRLFSGRPASEILSLDARAIFDAIGLADNLSAQRANGLGAMIERIKHEARAALETEGSHTQA